MRSSIVDIQPSETELLVSFWIGRPVFRTPCHEVLWSVSGACVAETYGQL